MVEEIFKYKKIKITPRQEEVLDLLCGGYTQKEIAQKLEMGLLTVDHHIKRSMSKFDCTTKNELKLRYAEYINYKSNCCIDKDSLL